ncbi:MAG: hypothetical protein HUJ68_03095 [Clostridia bacterium]|nr:hypothetical protein [Clostridia bacterium]
MSSSYVDLNAIANVIGCVYKYPYLLDCERYFFNEDDFPNKLHQTIFGAIYNLKALGANKINLIDIENYLKDRPQRLAEYKANNKGEDYLIKVSEMCNVNNFDVYYNKMKKMTLLRTFDSYGIDVRWLYDPDEVMNIRKRQKQEDWLDNSSLEEIAQQIEDKIEQIKSTYIDNISSDSQLAGKGIFELVENLKKTPEVGVPLYGNLINTITRGARLKKFYLRSAPTGAGK